MSKIKNPDSKKRLSLERDRRNTYFENAKSSRKNIPKSKQRTHMKERRGVAQVLATAKKSGDEDTLSATELKSKTYTSITLSRGFKKKPDTPLGVVIGRKKGYVPRK